MESPSADSFMQLLSPTKPPIPTTPKPTFDHLRSTAVPPSRAELVKKSQKLTQYFGKTPNPQAIHRNSFLDFNDQLDSDTTQYITAGPRRHSSPSTPDDFSSLSLPTDEPPQSIHSTINLSRKLASNRPASPTSFIDLSDDENPQLSRHPKNKRAPLSSPSSQSFFENMSREEQEEEERRRKREKLAKLHRFLGSRVPANLVLGLPDSPTSLPPVAEVPDSGQDTSRAAWLKRRRSSSAAALPAYDLDRLKEDLSEHEKAINVRRAIKMEKVFGTAPPQGLYHTRSQSSQPPLTDLPSLPSPVRGSSSGSMPSYKPKKSHRPGTSESSRSLLPKHGQDDHEQQSAGPSNYTYSRPRRTSLVYAHFQNSLSSLNDIIDRDDRESLAELHEYLNSPQEVYEDSDDPMTPRVTERHMSMSTIKSERRRSLPARTSMLSISSEYSLASPAVEVSNFQVRRRRAAKLTQFFGVDYRDLIRDVLDSIENGLEHERKRGTVSPEEAEDLLRKLRTIKTKRDRLY